MKKIILFLVTVIVTCNLAKAQAPNKFNYQAIARNGAGQGISNANIRVRISILDGGPNAASVYGETRDVTTNQMGLFTIAIGSTGAIATTGNFATINWGTGNKYIRVEADPQGGNNFVILGNSELLSVPYALYAVNAPTGPWAVNGNSISNTNTGITNINGSSVEVNAPAFFNASLDVDGSVDFGTGRFLFNSTTGNISHTGNISNTGNVTTTGNLVVSGDKGIIRNSTSSQLKYYTRTAAFTAVLAPFGTSVEGVIGFAAGIFTQPPAVMVGNIVSTGGTQGQLYRVQLMIYDVTTTSCKIRLINTHDGSVNYNVTWNIICIGE
jgi:hypothetical protein